MIVRFESQQSPRPFWLHARTRQHGNAPAPEKASLPMSERWLLGGITAVFIIWLFLHRILQPAWFRHMPGTFQELLWLSDIAGTLTLALVWLTVWWRKRAPMAVTYAHLSLPNLPLGNLYELTPREFEEYVAHLFRQKGYRVRLRGRSGDKGVDLELVGRGGRRAIVQCKRYRSTLGPDIVRELYGTLIHERVAHAFLVTSADISESARQWAQGKPITLIDGPTLLQIAAVLTSED